MSKSVWEVISDPEEERRIDEQTRKVLQGKAPAGVGASGSAGIWGRHILGCPKACKIISSLFTS